MKKICSPALITVIIALFSLKSNAQSISYYPFNSILSVATNPSNALWADFRLQMNSATSTLNTEVAPMINVAFTRNANFYVGGGVNFGVLGYVVNKDKIVKGFFGSIGTRAYPFEKAQRVGINFELSPYVDRNGESGLLRAWFGVSYNFGRSNN